MIFSCRWYTNSLRNIHVFLISTHSIKPYFIAAIVPLKSKILFAIQNNARKFKKRWIWLGRNLSLIKHLHTWLPVDVEPFQNATLHKTQIVPQAQFPFLFPKIHQYPLSFSRLTFLLNLILQGNIILQNIIWKNKKSGPDDLCFPYTLKLHYWIKGRDFQMTMHLRSLFISPSEITLEFF